MQLELERSKCLRISGRMREARAMVAGTTSLAPEEEEASALEPVVVEEPVVAEPVAEEEADILKESWINCAFTTAA